MQFIDFKSRLEILELRILALESENANLKSQIIILEVENKSLKLENTKLKDKLGLNSTNSSLPLSRDLYKIKNQSRPKSSRKPGGQPGHKGNFRKLLEPDYIVEYKLSDKCPQCDGHIIFKKPQIHQKLEIPKIEPIITNYHLARGECKKCKKSYKAPLPEGVTPDSFGPRAKAFVGMLTGFYGLTKRQAEDFFGNVCNAKVSLGHISNTEKKVSDKCATEYKKYLEILQSSDCLNIDETGAKNKGQRNWAWIFTDKSTSVLKIEASRGKKVLSKTLPDYKNTVITDRYSAYNYFDANQRQICWAHLLRDFERLANSSNLEIKNLGSKLCKAGWLLFKVFKNYKIGGLIESKFKWATQKIRDYTRKVLEELQNCQEAIGAKRVAKNILKHEQMMWKFLENPNGIELTNNLAERQVRKFVCFRKKSFFVWSDRGARFLERLLSLDLTCRLTKENSFTLLNSLVAL